MRVLKTGTAALLPLLIAFSSPAFAGGDAEWNKGVSSINQLKKQVNANSSDLRKAGVDVNALNRKLSWAESEMNRIRSEMLQRRVSERGSSALSGIMNQYDVFKSGAAFSANGAGRLVPVAPIVDMGLSNAFGANGTLVKCSSLYDVSPTIPFRPMRSPEEVLRANTGIAGVQAPGSPIDDLKIYAPPSLETPRSKESASSTSYGVIDPNALKADDPRYDLKISAPPLPKGESKPYAPPEPPTTGPYEVVGSNNTKVVSGSNLLPPEPRGPDKIGVAGYGEVEALGAKAKLGYGTEGLEWEHGGGKILEGSASANWDRAWSPSVSGKVGVAGEIPLSLTGKSSLSNYFVTYGAGRSWSSEGETMNYLEVGGGREVKVIPFGPYAVKAKVGVNFTGEWKADAPEEPNSKLYGPLKTNLKAK